MADANTPQKSGSTASSTPIQMDTVKPLQSQAVKIPSSPTQTGAQDADTSPDGEVAYSTTDAMADDAAGELGTEPTGLFGGISALAGGGGGMAAGAGAAGLALAGLGGAAGGGGSASSADSTASRPTASNSVQQNTPAGTTTDATSGKQTSTGGSETTQTETGKKPGETGTTTDNSGQGEASTSGPFTTGATTVTEKAPAESVPVAGAEAEKNIVSGGQAFDKGAADNGVAAPAAPEGGEADSGSDAPSASPPSMDDLRAAASENGLPTALNVHGDGGESVRLDVAEMSLTVAGTPVDELNGTFAAPAPSSGDSSGGGGDPDVSFASGAEMLTAIITSQPIAVDNPMATDFNSAMAEGQTMIAEGLTDAGQTLDTYIGDPLKAAADNPPMDQQSATDTLMSFDPRGKGDSGGGTGDGGGGSGDPDTSMPTLDASTLTAGAGLPSAPDDSGGSGGSGSDLFTVDPEGGQLSLPGGVSVSESGDTFDVGVPTRSISSTAGDSETTVIPMNPGQV